MTSKRHLTEHFDVLIVGAGLSGIGAAVHLQRGCPHKSYAILEGRGAIGGTWDLFRYPGIRSDSDMFTLGYEFKPWRRDQAIADGASIRAYLAETAREHGLDARIRFHHRVVSASWSSSEARWTLRVERSDRGDVIELTASFLWCCAGYYSYEGGYTPEWPGRERFGGRIVHPQKWTEDIHYQDKRVIVIGSGATAMTLVPSLAKRAAHVVMLQRSPTYVFARPVEDRVINALRRWLPEGAVGELARWKYILLGMALFQLSRRHPAGVKRWLLGRAKKELGPDFDVETHFTPRYDPWDERLCLIADGDLFDALRQGRASIVTDTIATFTEGGVRLASGRELDADLVVTATGLVLQFVGGMQIAVDGAEIEPSELLSYKGAMFKDVPNLACTFGYTNASWTLRADLTAKLVVRLLRRMDARGATRCTPRLTDPSVTPQPFIPLRAGYVQRALAMFPRQGSKRPWRVHQNYLLDILQTRFSRLEDEALELL